MERTKILETSLVLTTGFLLIYLLTQNELFLYLAFAFGITGIFIKLLAKYIAIAWFKLADILNYFMSKIILGTLFFVVLFPISLLYKISNKDKLRLKKSKDSTWIERKHSYSASDLKNIW
ncbi:MAG: hypothetical protein FD181_2480 [Prolixibacteraceae bacterium]|nr:MAG: hypothetical protein FD181_2480 [Prolixibacteraceae bacterium]